jgi:hypothetical protein
MVLYFRFTPGKPPKKKEEKRPDVPPSRDISAIKVRSLPFCLQNKREKINYNNNI